ncbi:MAG TPA: aminotransferase class V-fold PLP-dependent enzyme [Ktedonobacteraceae bacterium]|nr:aminotransferase class V-fold PLP-dependent enzyme [Ktedonobacteraceae bacterium]
MPDSTHIERLRQELPATRQRLYLNTGTFGPLPACSVEAMQQSLQSDLQDGRLGMTFFERMGATYEAARQGVARLLHVDNEEIALTDNTGEGLNIISYGLNWQAGDEIITTNHEHISLLAPLYQLRARYGVEVRVADLGERAERPVLKAVADLVTPRTRLIALSHVTWSTGSRLDVAEVGYMGREHGIPVLVDGAQSAGAIPLDLHALGVDFYAIPGQKWLCGPDGTGALYVRREALNYVTSTYVGYWSAEDAHAAEWKLQENAKRFEVGGRQTAAVAAQARSLQWLEETVGHDWLFARIAELNHYAAQTLPGVPGLRLLSPRPGDSGLLSFTLEGKDPEQIVAYLGEQHQIAIRSIPDNGSLRVSTGFYNTEAEIDTLVRALTAYQHSH